MTMSEHQLAELTRKVAANASDTKAHDDWLSQVQIASSRTLVAVTSLLSSSGSRPANIKTLREAIISEIERKNTEHLVDTMEKLDASAVTLGHYSLVLAVIGVILAAVQVLQAFGFLRSLTVR